MSKGVMPFGPTLEAASVLQKDSECSWISAKLKGQNGIVAAGEILNDLKQQVFFFFLSFYCSRKVKK
jgi:hypothetical protein